jgi:hypothetical protein
MEDVGMSESIVFVVRVWTGPGFRAVVRQVDDEQTHLFETPAALARFFGALPPVVPPQTDDWRTR